MIIVVVAVLATWPLLPRAAHAADSDQETIARIVELNRDGVAQYEKKHFDAARKALKQALDLCESAGLDHHPVAARTHIHLGIVIIAGYGQREIGSRQFNEALLIDPNIALTPGLATPAAEEVFNESVVALSSRATPASTEAQAPSEAREQAGDDAPGVARRTPPTHSHRPNTQDGEDDEAAAGSLESRVQVGALLGGGVGWASGTGDLNADTHVSGAFAAAKLGHLALEGGYWLSDELMVSVAGRLQMVTGTTEVEANNRTYHAATYATAIFAAATWAPEGAHAGHLRPYVSVAVGGGRIRHVVTLAGLKDCGPARNQVCVDTVGAGPFLAGVGGGLMYDLADRLALVVALNTQVAAPTFTFNVDLNVGVAFRL